MRKFWLTLAALTSFTIVMIMASVDPFNLGLGLGALLSPTSIANAFEHKYNNKKPEEK